MVESIAGKEFMSRERAIYIAGFVAIMGTAVVLRLRTLGVHSFWDDDVTYLFMARDFGFFFGDSASFKGLTLFLTLLNLWNRLTNDQIMLSLLPASLGVVAVWLIIRLGQSLFDRVTGLFAGMFLAISPLHVYSSLELKAYPLLMCLTLASILFLDRCRRKLASGMKDWIILGILNAAVLYTHYAGGLLLVTMTLYVFLVRRRYPGFLLTFVKSASVTTLIYGPWLVFGVLGHFFHISRFVDNWVPPFQLRSLAKTAFHLTAGYHSPQKIGIAMAIIVLGLAAFAVLVARREAQDTTAGVFLLLTMTVVPPLIVIMAAQWRNVYLDRYLMFISGPMLLLAAWGLTRIRRGIVTVIITTTFAALSIMPLAFIHLNRIPREDAGIYMRKDVRAATRYLEKQVRNDEIVVHSSNSCINGIRFYHEPADPFQQRYVVLRDTEFDRFTGFIDSASRINVDILPRFLPTTLLEFDTFWFVHSSWATSFEDDEPALVKNWLLERFDCLSTWECPGITIIRLARRRNTPLTGESGTDHKVVTTMSVTSSP